MAENKPTPVDTLQFLRAQGQAVTTTGISEGVTTRTFEGKSKQYFAVRVGSQVVNIKLDEAKPVEVPPAGVPVKVVSEFELYQGKLCCTRIRSVQTFSLTATPAA